jgi:TIR domain
MTVMVSYAREDATAVGALVADLEQRAHLDVWFDRDLRGGQDWWNTILAQIRSCELFLIALSPDSLRSKACMSELDYAAQLNRPLLGVRVKDVKISLLPRAIADGHIVNYQKRSADAVFELMSALAARAPAPSLPTPLPRPPASPLTYMFGIGQKVGAPGLSYGEQMALVADLRRVYNDDPSERETAAELLQRLGRRPDIAQGVKLEIDQVLSGRSRRTPDKSRSLVNKTGSAFRTIGIIGGVLVVVIIIILIIAAISSSGY